MAKSFSVGSDIFAVVALLVISLLVLALIRHYLPLRSTPAYLVLPVFLALALPCSIILLVPIDLASADGSSSRGIWLPERAVLVTWRIVYWLTFLLTWFLLPFLGEYCDSGERDAKSRMIYSLRSNAQYIMITLGTGIAGLVYFILQNGFHLESIKSLIMALAYAWGLILAIGLMGHGLVALPRRLYKNASVAGRLRNLQTQAPRLKDKLDDATDDLDQLEHTAMQLRQRKNGTSRDLRDWIDDLADTTVIHESRPGVAAAIRSSNPTLPAVVTERYLADLTRKLKRARHRKARFVNEWTTLCDQAEDAQAILGCASSKKLDLGRETLRAQSLIGRVKFITPSMRYQLYTKVIPYARIGVAILLSLASVMIVFSEFVRPFASKISIMSLTVIHHPNSDTGKVGFIGQLIAAAWLMYMDVCALYAISDVKVWGNRALVKRQTYAESACWYSLQVAKLTVPLSFNFITMLPEDVYKQTSFYTFLGQLINLTPLGKGFSNFFPCFLLIPVLASLLNLYSKAKNIIGFGVLEDDSEDNPTGFGTGGWREGRALIDRELQSRNEGDGAVGLAARGASLDLESRAAIPSANATPTPSSRPAVATARDPARPAAPTASANIQEANRQFNSITNQRDDDGEDDESPRHFYQDLTERVRNTFDTVERPEWMRNLGSGIKVPKWMQKDQRDAADGPAAGLARWFGGRPEEGRVQI